MNVWLPISLASALVCQAPAPSTSGSLPFEGTWRLDPARSESAAGGTLTDPVLLEITRTDRDIVITTTQGTRQHRAVHAVVAAPTAPYSIDGAAGRAYWSGDALVTEGTRLVQGQTVATRETRRLSTDGTEMMVEVVVIVQHGYAIRGGRNFGIGRDTYVRVK